MKKYELTDVRIKARVHESALILVLHQIRALRDLHHEGLGITINAGDLGGYIQSEDNLSHEGDCWISNGCVVGGNAKVKDDVLVMGNILLFGNMTLEGDSFIIDNSGASL